MKKLKILLIICSYGHLYSTPDQEAVCVVPVADLVGGSLATPDVPALDQYQNLPLNGHAQQVKRIDQLIFNEPVVIKEVRGQESHIYVPTHGYCTKTDTALHHEFWTLNKNIAALKDLENTNTLPDSIDQLEGTQQTITLLEPFHDQKHHVWFSAGTRFKLDELQDDEQYYRVLLLSPHLKAGHVYIPKEICLNTCALSAQEKIDQFLTILNKFAQPVDGCIPYVFGGNSFVKPYEQNYPVQEYNHNLTTDYPTRTATHSGFDCASLIFRAAQMAGIPIVFKNSTAIRNYLKPIAHDQTTENGDIIYIPGHIMVLADKELGLIIEARTQSHGYGYVQKIPLEKEFKELTSIEKLIEYHHSQKPVTRLNIHGEVITRLPVTVLSLRSVFEN